MDLIESDNRDLWYKWQHLAQEEYERRLEEGRVTECE